MALPMTLPMISPLLVIVSVPLYPDWEMAVPPREVIVP